MIEHPVPKNLLVHIGDITVSFALLELQIQMLIGSLINDHQRVGQIITAELSFRNLRALANSLYKERFGENSEFATLVDLMKRAQKLEERRNEVSHSIWAAGNTADTITRVKTTAKEKPGLRFRFEQLGEPELAKVASDLRLLANEVLEFLIKPMKSGEVISNP